MLSGCLIAAETAVATCAKLRRTLQDCRAGWSLVLNGLKRLVRKRRRRISRKKPNCKADLVL